nr:proteinase [Sobelivirales sp.]
MSTVNKLDDMIPENYEFDDDSFGMNNVCQYTNDAMALTGTSSEKAQSILTEVLVHWPTVYANGGRKNELMTLVKHVVLKNLTIVMILLLILPCSMCESLGDVGSKPLGTRAGIAPPPRTREKREGLGQWEQDDTVNIVSKWGKQVIGTIVAEEHKIVESVEAIAEKVEQEIKVLVVSSGRVIVWTTIIFAILIILRLTYPVIWFLMKFCWRCITATWRLVVTSTVCMKCCALAPFIAIRNWWIRKRAEVYDNQVVVEEALELQPTTLRNRSEVYFDEFGPYVKAAFGEKIYFARTQLDVPTYMALGNSLPSERFSEERVKETMIARSMPHTSKGLPDFQAYFTIDGNVVGHCSRIAFLGQDCLLTAYHVLSYNKKADLFINANGKAIRFSDVRVRLLAFSNENNFDYVVLSVPATICSKLGLKKAKLAKQLTHGSPISIHQIIGGKTCYTVGIANKGSQPWTISYGASTVEGSSGAPVLNVRKEIVGVHIEGGRVANVGVIPELLRNRRESPQNGDINAEDPQSYEDDEYDYERREQYENYEDEQDRLEREIEEDEETRLTEAEKYYQYQAREETYEKPAYQNWEEAIDEAEMDDYYYNDGLQSRKTFKLKSNFRVWKTERGDEGRHIGQRIKGGRYRKETTRKESPWTCSKCLTLHKNAGYNCVKCGYCLKPSVKKVFDAKKEPFQEVANGTASMNGMFLPEVADKILKHIETLSVKYQNLEQMIKTAQKGSMLPQYGGAGADSLMYSEMHEVAKDIQQFPKKVTMDKDLAQCLQTSKERGANFGNHVTSIRPANGKIFARIDGDDGDRSIVASAPLQVEVVKKKRPRRKKVAKKETVVPEQEQSAVPLNSKAPLRDGATTTNGLTNHNSSQPKVKLSASPSAHFIPPSGQKKVSTGSKPRPSTQA